MKIVHIQMKSYDVEIVFFHTRRGSSFRKEWAPKPIHPLKKEGKDQESIQSTSSTTPDPGYQWESDVTITQHKREPRGQPFPSPFFQSPFYKGMQEMEITACLVASL